MGSRKLHFLVASGSIKLSSEHSNTTWHPPASKHSWKSSQQNRDAASPKTRSSIQLAGNEAQRGSKICTKSDTVGIKALLTPSPGLCWISLEDCDNFSTDFYSSGLFLPVPKHRIDQEYSRYLRLWLSSRTLLQFMCLTSFCQSDFQTAIADLNKTMISFQCYCIIQLWCE